MDAFQPAPCVQNYPLTKYPKVMPNSPFADLVTGSPNSKVPVMMGSQKDDGSFLLSRTYPLLLGVLDNPA